MSDVEVKVKSAVAEILSKNVEEIKNELSFTEDLGADSLDLAQLIMKFEDDFEITIPDEDQEELTTVQKAIDYVTEKLA